MRGILLFAFLVFSVTVESQTWNTDFQKSFQSAKAEGKNILLHFTIAKGCEVCRSLENKVIADERFQQYVAQRYIPVRIDFSNAAASDFSDPKYVENLLIVERYNKDGFFPLLVVISPSGKALGRIDAYATQTPDTYIRLLQSIN